MDRKSPSTKWRQDRPPLTNWQFDDLGLLCVSHYVAEAPQEFEALLDGPQEPEHEMAPGQTASHKVGNSTNSVCFACRTMWRKRPRRSRRCPMDRKWAG